MFLEYLLIIFLGILFGVFTGLIPGIHTNLVAIVLLSNISLFLSYFSIDLFVILIICMGITHTFVSFIPALLFGVPSSDTALSILPGHRLVLKGEAYKAIKISSFGSFYGVLFALVFSVVFFLFLEKFYDFVFEFVPYFLIFIVVFLVLFEKSWNLRFWALIIVLFSSGLGMIGLNILSVDYPLLVLFTGLFGVSTLLYSLKNNEKIPKQKFDFKFKFDFLYFKSLILGGLSSAFCSFSPGVGNAQAATICSFFVKDLSSERFLFVLSCINTINFILSLVTLYIIDRARNGTIFVVGQVVDSIEFYDVLFYLGFVPIVAFVCLFLTLILGKFFIKIISFVNTFWLNIFILVFLFVLVGYLTGILGILLLICSSSLGFFCILIGVRRIHLMSVLIVPVVLILLI